MIYYYVFKFTHSAYKLEEEEGYDGKAQNVPFYMQIFVVMPFKGHNP